MSKEEHDFEQRFGPKNAGAVFGGSESTLLFFVRPEHSCGNPGYEAAGDEAFAVSAEIIFEAGDDVTLARSQRFQSRLRDFFCALGIALEFFLAGDNMKFRFGRAWAKSAYANSMWFHFFGESFGEKEIEGFSRRVG